MQEIGTTLKRLLDENDNMKVAELARRSGIPKTTLYSIISRNQRKTDIDTLHKIAKGFGIGFDELLSEFIADGTAEITFPDDNPRQGYLKRIHLNENKLNDSWIEKLADYSDDLVSSGKYKK